MGTIEERAEEGAIVLSLGASSCRISGAGEARCVAFFKGPVELPHLRAEGLAEADARSRAEAWLRNEAGAFASFGVRRGARVRRLEDAAERKQAEADGAAARANAIGQRFEGGQPVLVGHHSEGKARRDKAKMHAAMGKAVAATAEADDLLRRARAAAKNATISSDDPDGIAKLADKIERLELDRARLLILRKASRGLDRYKDHAVIASKQSAALAQIDGMSDEDRLAFCKTYLLPAEDWTVKNLGATIRQTRGRLEALLAAAARVPPAEEEINGARIVEDENRVRVYFGAERAPDRVREFLGGRGFHWSGAAGAWQRMPGPNPDAVWGIAREAARMLGEGGA